MLGMAAAKRAAPARQPRGKLASASSKATSRGKPAGPRPAPGRAARGAPAPGAAVSGRAARSADVAHADAALFAPLTPGETAEAVRTMIEDRRLASMAKIGRYRVICTEPLVIKPPHWMAGHRLARVVAYDYSQARAVDACVDLDAGVVAHLELTRSQPMLAREEEALAVSIASVDRRVRDKQQPGDIVQCVMHHWGRVAGDPAFDRRSAAVLYGHDGGHTTFVAVVDLVDQVVTSVVLAEAW